MAETKQLLIEDILFSKRNIDISYDPFCYFSVDEFLPNEIYEYCARNYPGPDYYTHRNISKYYFDSVNDVDMFNDICRQHAPWDTLLKHFSSDRFIQDTRQLLLKGIMQSRDDDWTNLPIAVNFQFSRMESGDQIYPHTDNVKKLFSLLMYFPEPGWKNEYGGGTEFYRVKSPADASKWSYWVTKKFKSNKDLETFRKEMTCFYTAEYKPNNLVGFVKSHDSYHAVSPLKCGDGMSRNCLNINFRIGGNEVDNY